MGEHKRWIPSLDSYELEEVYARVNRSLEPQRLLRIRIHGSNLLMRAAEPVVRVGDVDVLYPTIDRDEMGITGFLPRMPQEGALITFTYDDAPDALLAVLREPFSTRGAKRVSGEARPRSAS